MQKKLIALAIAGLGLTASAAFAQSNVTIYGLMDASVDVTKNGDSTAGIDGIRTTKISSNSSRIGFKGSEDLGDGLKAVFQIESAINVDNNNGGAGGAGAWNSRNTYVGLAGGWGSVKLGNMDTPYKTSTRGFDLFADHLADNRNLMGRGVVAFDERASSTVRFDSADYNGFSFAAAHVAGAENAVTSGPVLNQKKGNAWSLSGTYTNGPWTGTLAHERHNFGSGGTGTLGAISVAGVDEQEKASKLGVGYKADAFRVGFAYEHTNDDFTSHQGHNAWTLGGGYTFGNNEAKLAYTKAGTISGTSDTGAKQWAIGIDHILSKRTLVYAEYVKLSNDNNANYGLTGAGNFTTGAVSPTFGGGADPSALQLGIKHAF